MKKKFQKKRDNVRRQQCLFLPMHKIYTLNAAMLPEQKCNKERTQYNHYHCQSVPTSLDVFDYNGATLLELCEIIIPPGIICKTTFALFLQNVNAGLKLHLKHGAMD